MAVFSTLQSDFESRPFLSINYPFVPITYGTGKFVSLLTIIIVFANSVTALIIKIANT